MILCILMMIKKWVLASVLGLDNVWCFWLVVLSLHMVVFSLLHFCLQCQEHDSIVGEMTWSVHFIISYGYIVVPLVVIELKKEEILVICWRYKLYSCLCLVILVYVRCPSWSFSYHLCTTSYVYWQITSKSYITLQIFFNNMNQIIVHNKHTKSFSQVNPTRINFLPPLYLIYIQGL